MSHQDNYPCTASRTRCLLLHWSASLAWGFSWALPSCPLRYSPPFFEPSVHVDACTEIYYMYNFKEIRNWWQCNITFGFKTLRNPSMLGFLTMLTGNVEVAIHKANLLSAWSWSSWLQGWNLDLILKGFKSGLWIITCSFLFLLDSVSAGGGQRRSEAGVPDAGIRARFRAAAKASCFSERFTSCIFKSCKWSNTFDPSKHIKMMCFEVITEICRVHTRKDPVLWIGSTMFTLTFLYFLIGFRVSYFELRELLMDDWAILPSFRRIRTCTSFRHRSSVMRTGL